VINWSRHTNTSLAVHQLHLQGVIAYPTEAVWGLGCDPYSYSAVAKILSLKSRPEHKGVILIACDWQQFSPFTEGLTATQLDQLQQPISKPITWLIPHNGVAPDWIVGDHDTLAIRVTSHPLAASLCRSFGGPIVSTSANPQGLPEATSSLKVRSYFGRRLDAIASGTIGSATAPSEIRHLLNGKIIRKG
jgi:L-threonylcarbamoyladenylate synthase